MQILSVNDNEFKKYGRVVDNVDFTELIQELKRTPIPSGVVYEPAVKELEALPIRLDISSVVYGEMPIQIGYCNGHNSKLNALEYHRDSEINIAATDMILMLGLLTDVNDDYIYDTANVKAFRVPAGTAVEVYSTTLHYAPCGIDGKGFQVAVVLPKGTNYPLKSKHIRIDNKTASTSNENTGSSNINEDALLAAANKWLIGHAEGGLDDSAYIGLKGENIEI